MVNHRSVPAARSFNMARIPNQDTRPEMQLRRALWVAGLRYRLRPKLPGTPDLVFRGARLAVFVDGCFWHGCPEHYSSPSTRVRFWAEKLKRNVARDADADRQLRNLGFRILHIWQHELRELERVVANVVNMVNQASARKHRNHESTSLWWRCECGSGDAQVVSMAPGLSLKPRARNRPVFAAIRCRACAGTKRRKVR